MLLQVRSSPFTSARERANLVERWERAFGQAAPPHLSRQLLERSLAHRLQAKREGNLSKRAKATLHAVANGQPSLPTRPPAPGSKLIREWNGILHVVDVLEKGFEYRGRYYRSLTRVAEEITGAHWPGPRFFGLRRRCK